MARLGATRLAHTPAKVQLSDLLSEDVFEFRWKGSDAAVMRHDDMPEPRWLSAFEKAGHVVSVDWFELFEGAGAKPDWKSSTADGGGSGNGKGGKKPGAPETTDGGSAGGDTTTDGGTSGGSTTTGGTGSTAPSYDFVSGLDTPDGYNIAVTYSGNWTTELKALFEETLERISDYVTGDLPDHNGIDDLHITATIGNIDGSGGFFGWGGYTSARPDSGLPSVGYITFDVNDLSTMLNYGVFDDFTFHEILHAMGFGTAWQSIGLIETIDGSLRFTGANATEAYNAEFRAIAENDPLSSYGVPVEMDGGSGTAGVHWDHDTFGTEMMTGTLGLTNTISNMTLAALEDMGYQSTYGDNLLVG